MHCRGIHVRHHPPGSLFLSLRSFGCQTQKESCKLGGPREKKERVGKNTERWSRKLSIGWQKLPPNFDLRFQSPLIVSKNRFLRFTLFCMLEMFEIKVCQGIFMYPSTNDEGNDKIEGIRPRNSFPPCFAPRLIMPTRGIFF